VQFRDESPPSLSIEAMRRYWQNGTRCSYRARSIHCQGLRSGPFAYLPILDPPDGFVNLPSAARASCDIARTNTNPRRELL
jgi:hypothetical protein